MSESYQCDGCGACCRNKLVDVYEVDAIRDPRIADQMLPLCEPGFDGEIGYLNCIRGGGCAFLDDESCCSIYPTRPTVCVLFEPGDEDCQQCRRDAGIPLLKPVVDA